MKHSDSHTIQGLEGKNWSREKPWPVSCPFSSARSSLLALGDRVYGVAHG